MDACMYTSCTAMYRFAFYISMIRIQFLITIWFVFLFILVPFRMVYHCVQCNHDKRERDMKTKPKSRQGVCKNCFASSIHQQRHQNDSPLQIKPIFHPTLSIHSHLSIEKRASIVAFHRIGIKKKDIMQYITCSMPTVNHWINHYNKHYNLNDDDRSGNN
jgi:hypothetical protein